MNGASQKSILIAICLVATVTIGGAMVSRESTVQIIGFGSMISVYLLQMLHQMKAAQRTADKLDVAAKKVDDVKNVLAVNTKANVASKVETAEVLQGIAQVGNANHTLLNNNMGLQLLATAKALEEVASMRPADQEAWDAAEQARKLYDAHMRKQDAVDQVKDRQDKKDSI